MRSSGDKAAVAAAKSLELQKLEEIVGACGGDFPMLAAEAALYGGARRVVLACSLTGPRPTRAPLPCSCYVCCAASAGKYKVSEADKQALVAWRHNHEF